MSDDRDDRDDRDDLDALAAEYVLGTLDAAGRREAETRLGDDPVFAQMVEAWSGRLAPLAEVVPPVEPSPEVWRRIAEALPERRTGPDPAAGLLRRLAGWRRIGFAATAVAACLAVYVAVGEFRAPPETRFMAVLESGPAKPAWLVTVDTAARTLTVRPLGGLTRTAGAFELWLIRPGAPAPRSLGLLDPQADRSIAIPASLKTSAGGAVTLAVSLEPAGGSPTGLPTGPVVYKGTLRTIAN